MTQNLDIINNNMLDNLDNFTKIRRKNFHFDETFCKETEEAPNFSGFFSKTSKTKKQSRLFRLSKNLAKVKKIKPKKNK